VPGWPGSPRQADAPGGVAANRSGPGQRDGCESTENRAAVTFTGGPQPARLLQRVAGPPRGGQLSPCAAPSFRAPTGRLYRGTWDDPAGSRPEAQHLRARPRCEFFKPRARTPGRPQARLASRPGRPRPRSVGQGLRGQTAVWWSRHHHRRSRAADPPVRRSASARQSPVNSASPGRRAVRPRPADLQPTPRRSRPVQPTGPAPAHQTRGGRLRGR